MSKALTVAGILFVLYGVLITSPLRWLAPAWASYPYLAYVLLLTGAFAVVIPLVTATEVSRAWREGTLLKETWWLFAVVGLIAVTRLI